MTEKRCPRCKLTKEIGEFGVRAGKPSCWCRQCNREHVKKWQKENPDKVLNVRSNSKFKRMGVTAADYWAIHEAQGGCCAACGTQDFSPFLNKRTRFDIDHCHETGRIRGLLCQPCNLVVGLMKDDASRVRLLAAYLERVS